MKPPPQTPVLLWTESPAFHAPVHLSRSRRKGSAWLTSVSHVGILVVALFTGAAAAQPSGLAILHNQVLVVDTANTATGWLLIQNTSSVSTNFALSVGPFVSLTTSNVLGARLTLGTGGTAFIEVRNMAPGSNLVVKFDMANFLEA